jgi:hypothetical protein
VEGRTWMWRIGRICSCYVPVMTCCSLVSSVLAFTGQGTGSWGRWMMSQSQYIYSGFIREKGKAIAWEVQWSLEAGNLLLRWRLGFYGRSNSGLGRFFSLAVDSWAFSGELVWFAPLWGRGNNLGSIFLIHLVADLSDPVFFL